MKYSLVLITLFFVVTSAPAVVAQQVDTAVVYTLADTAQARALLLEALSLANNQKFEAAIEKAEKSKKIYAFVLGQEVKEMSNYWHVMGMISYKRGQYVETQDFWEKSLDIRIKVFGEEHQAVAESCINLGGICKVLGDFIKGIEYLEKSIKIQEKLNINNLNIVRALNNLASTYNSLDNPDAAIFNTEKGIKILGMSGQNPPLSASLYNQLGLAYSLKGNIDSSMHYYSKAYEIVRAVYGNESFEIATSSTYLGAVYEMKGEYDLAIQYYNRAISIYLTIVGESHPETASAYGKLGVCYILKGEIDLAYKYLTSALNIYINLMGENNSRVAAAYSHLGRIWMYKGDIEKSIQYQNKSLLIYHKLEKSELNIANCYQNLGQAFHMKGDYNHAISYYEKSYQISKDIYGSEHINIAAFFNNMAALYTKTNKDSLSLLYLNKAKLIFEKILGYSHPDIGLCYLNIALSNTSLGRYGAAFNALDSAYVILAKNSGADSINLIQFYNIKSTVCLQSGDFENGWLNVIKCIKLLKYKPGDSIENPVSVENLYTALQTAIKIQIKWYEKNRKKDHLYTARKLIASAKDVIDYHRENISRQSKSDLSTEASSISDIAIATNHLLFTLTDSIHYWHESFDYAERSKAFLLYEAMQETDALHVAGIPDSLLQQEYDLRVDIAYYDKKRQEKLSAGLAETDTTVLAVGNKLFDLNRRYESLKKRFETEYPRYYKAKYDLHTVSVAEIQRELLRPGQTLLEYTVGDSSVFLFIVQNDHFEVREIKRDFPLEQWVNELTREGIYGFYTQPASGRTRQLEAQTVQNYTHAAQRLYEKLLGPIEGKLTGELIVIPDGVLGYVPFEALLTGTPGRNGVFSSYPFLLKKYQVSYCYSATLLREMRDKQHRRVAQNQLLALAPFFLDDVAQLKARIDSTDLLASLTLRDSLQALPASGEEVASVTRLWKGAALYGAAASLEQFHALAAQHRILHLSTHGQADDRQGDYAYLAFAGPTANDPHFDKLYARDLYNLELNADLVVLSACETGAGKLRRGEGVVSMARAFAYAGAKSLVTTLWKVNDEKTKDLMVGFYRALRAGKTKDAALRQAKLDFFERNRGNGGASLHPFFWAGFIAVGDMRPVRQ